MQDQLNRNPLSITGTPTLVTGALTVDSDQGASFNGPTSFGSAADSASLSITGSLSIELFLRLTAYPGTAQYVVFKNGSYGIGVDTTGHVVFTVIGGTTTSVLTNVALQTNRWYHLVCVYNGEYAGPTQFGTTTLGTSQWQVDDDNGNNKAVTKVTLAESALLTGSNVSLQYIDEIWAVQMCAVVYSDSDGVPGALVTKSDMQVLNLPMPRWRNWTWVNFPLTPAVVPAGTYHIGYVADTVAGLPKAPLVVGRNAAGTGTISQCSDSVSGPSNPFGTVVLTNAGDLAIYCDYTPVSRTGRENKTLIYIDGALNVSTPRKGDLADTTNALEVCPSLAAQVDELSVWNKALTDVQIATHYTAH